MDWSLEPNLVNLGATFVREGTEQSQPIDYIPLMIYIQQVVSLTANATNGVPVAVEIWSVPADGVATLLSKEPPRPFNRED